MVRNRSANPYRRFMRQPTASPLPTCAAIGLCLALSATAFRSAADEPSGLGLIRLPSDAQELPPPNAAFQPPSGEPTATPSPAAEEVVTPPAEEIVIPQAAWDFWAPHYWDPWEGSVELGLSGTEGNTETFNVRFGLKAKHKTEHLVRTLEVTSIQKTAAG